MVDLPASTCPMKTRLRCSRPSKVASSSSSAGGGMSSSGSGSGAGAAGSSLTSHLLEFLRHLLGLGRGGLRLVLGRRGTTDHELLLRGRRADHELFLRRGRADDELLLGRGATDDELLLGSALGGGRALEDFGAPSGPPMVTCEAFLGAGPPITSSFFGPEGAAGAGRSKNTGGPPGGGPGGGAGGGAGPLPPAPEGRLRGLNANALGLKAVAPAFILVAPAGGGPGGGGGPSLIALGTV